MSNDMPDLLPCPFCGGEAKHYCSQVNEDTCEDYVQCRSCFVQTDHHETTMGGNGSKHSWNTRADPASVTLPKGLVVGKKEFEEAAAMFNQTNAKLTLEQCVILFEVHDFVIKNFEALAKLDRRL